VSGWDDEADFLGGGGWIEVDREPEPEPPRRGLEWGPAQRRLAALIGGAILLIVILVVAISSCGTAKGSAERAYLAKLAAPAAGSEQIGVQFSALLRKSPTLARVSLTLTRLAGAARQTLAAVQALKPPKLLQQVNVGALQAFQLRASALQAMSQVLAEQPGAATASRLAKEGKRLVASDVIWQDLVQSVARSRLAAVDITATPLPASQFVRGVDLVRVASFRALLKGGAAAGGAAGGPVLKLGDHSAAVVTWQRQVNRWIMKTGAKVAQVKPDGSFGPATEAATKALQTSAKLTPDGIVGAKTRQALSCSFTRPLLERTTLPWVTLRMPMDTEKCAQPTGFQGLRQSGQITLGSTPLVR